MIFISQVKHFAAVAAHDVKVAEQAVEATLAKVIAAEPTIEKVASAAVLVPGGQMAPVLVRLGEAAIGAMYAAFKSLDNAASADNGLNVSFDAEAVAAFKAVLPALEAVMHPSVVAAAAAK